MQQSKEFEMHKGQVQKYRNVKRVRNSFVLNSIVVREVSRLFELPDFARKCSQICTIILSSFYFMLILDVFSFPFAYASDEKETSAPEIPFGSPSPPRY